MNKLGDAGGFKDADVGAAKNQLLSSFVYKAFYMEELKLNLSESTAHWWERLAQRHAERKFSAEHPDTLRKTENVVRIFFESLVHQLFIFCWNRYKTFYAQQWAPLSTQTLSEEGSSASLPSSTSTSQRELDATIADQAPQERPHSEERSALEETLQESTLPLHESEENLRALQQQVTSLERALAAATARFEEAQVQQLDLPEMEQPPAEDPRIITLSQQNSRLHEENKAQESELEALRQKVSQQERLLQRPLEETERTRAENHRLTVALGRAEQQIGQMREELAGFADLQTHYDLLNDRCRQAEESLERASSQQRMQEAAHERLATEHRDLKSAHNQLIEESHELRRALEALEKQLEKAKESEQRLSEKLEATEAAAIADHDEQSSERHRLEETLTTQAQKEKSLLEQEQRCLTLEEENRELREKIAVLIERSLWEESENGDPVATAITSKRPAFNKPPTPKKFSASKKIS